jgi:hypothetical protein
MEGVQMRRWRHVSLHRSDWERNDPFVLTIYTKVALRVRRQLTRFLRSAQCKSPVCDGRAIDHPSKLLLAIIYGDRRRRSYTEMIWMLHLFFRRDPSAVNRKEISVLPVNRKEVNGFALLNYDENMELPLLSAINGDTQWIRPLLDFGADANVCRIPKVSRFEHSIFFTEEDIIVHSMIKQVSKDNFRFIVSRCNDETLNHRSEGETPVMYACRLQRFPLSERYTSILLDHAHEDGSGVNLDGVELYRDKVRLLARAFGGDPRRQQAIDVLFANTRQRFARWKTGLREALTDILTLKPLVNLVEFLTFVRP